MGTLRALRRGVADGMLVSPDSLFRANQARIAQGTRKAGLPAIFPFSLDREDGALMSYGPSIRERRGVWLSTSTGFSKALNRPSCQSSKCPPTS